MHTSIRNKSSLTPNEGDAVVEQQRCFVEELPSRLLKYRAEDHQHTAAAVEASHVLKLFWRPDAA